MAFMGGGADKAAKTVTVKGAKLKEVAELLKVKDAGDYESATVEFSPKAAKSKSGGDDKKKR
jgi:hypothetical protein